MRKKWSMLLKIYLTCEYAIACRFLYMYQKILQGKPFLFDGFSYSVQIFIVCSGNRASQTKWEYRDPAYWEDTEHGWSSSARRGKRFAQQYLIEFSGEWVHFLILVILSVKTLSKFRCLYMPLLPPWTQDVNWTYIGCTQDFWRFSTKFYERFSCKPYVRSLNLSCMLHWIMLTSTIWSIFRE